MPDSPDPAIARRRLAQELRDARKEAEITQGDVAREMGWHESKVRRIEQAKVGIGKNDLRMLLRLYGQEYKFEDLWGGAPSRRRASRWQAEHELLSADVIRYLEYEESAAIIREYQSVAVPGLLQTPDYARRMIEVFAKPSDDEGRKAGLLRIRLTRQQLWSERRRCRLVVLLDQAVISRHVGGPAAMRAQLEKLRTLSLQENVSIRLIPFDRDAHAGMAGPFTLLDFGGAADRGLYLGDAPQELSISDPDIVDPFVKVFTDLTEIAASSEESVSLIDAEISRLQSLETRSASQDGAD
ncbi:helix-turn-helix domain-containing protein [Cryptosporangium sp. NPDC048952]|uniref:helix-turn-helix domain-containing protein n=1 Tax=Cryptosporangium sp. NPDC048952 TaxID=3363961 RepID=UPI00372324D4